jgi:hypothetical protein
MTLVELRGCLVARNGVETLVCGRRKGGAKGRMGQPIQTGAGRNNKRATDTERCCGWLSGKSSGGQKSYGRMRRETKLQGSSRIKPLRR